MTNPLDVIKTRLQTQNLEPCPTPVTSPIVTKTKTKTVTANSRSGPGSGTGSGSGTILFNNSLPSTPLSNLRTPQISSVDNTVRTYVSSATRNNLENENLNFEEIGKKKSNSTFKSAGQVVRYVVREEGYMGFLRGLAPRMMLHAPAVAISWTTYESVKSILVKLESV